ncbi:DUF5686 family protein [Roseivirga sp.]|uniref:DUF5686 and carboxypeptidase-like regulatory domain-containing protein n=1 Tax=Roseivirga sp. TaxID=1964215 RepID=UPI003B8E256F
MKLKSFFSIFIFFASLTVLNGQTVITGKVIDAESGDPIPFANVVIKGTTIGSTTDFDGFYKIEGDAKSDSVFVSYIGYEKKYKIYKKGITQTINFQLQPESTALDDFVVYARKQENPAFAIMRSVIDNKKKNDKRGLDAYEYESYNKIEIDVDNITDKLREKKYMQKIAAVLDSIETIAGDDGKPILPLFISESLSKFYYRDNPRLQKEEVQKTRIKGVGIEDGSLISQIIGSSFQEYNFYQNRMNIVEREFASPIGDAWRLIYNYELEDSVYIGDEFCYLLDFKPKNDQELAFIGKVWIAKEDFGVKQIDATMQPTANLNFIEKIKIQQELERTETGAWLPVKSRILIDVLELTNKSAGFLAKFYSSNKNLKVTEPKPTKFFERTIELAEDAREQDEKFWSSRRHDKLSDTEINVMAMIDSLNQVPFVKTWTEIFKTIARGYVEVGKFDLGPWPFLVGANDVEGFRLRLGGRTNENFSRKWQFNGYAAYGFQDERLKYGLGANLIVDRDKWTTLSLSYRNDIDQFGIQPDPLTSLGDGSAFLALTQLGNLVRPFRYQRYQFDASRQFSRAFSAVLQVKKQDYRPAFDFRYRTDLTRTDSPLATDFSTTEATIRLKYARDETFLINDNSRFSLGTLRWPIFLFSYTRGFSGLGGDFDYNKVNFGISQRLKMGFWGVSTYQVSAGKIFDDVPYPLLTAHIGNEQFVYTDIAYNTMNFFEFVSQSYASLSYQHKFGGFVFNRIPLMKKLKWRLVGTGNVLFGGVSDSTLAAQVRSDEGGNDLPFFNVLESGRPFAEVGLGVENIFKFFRVDFVRRLTYLENDGIDKTSIKFSFNLSL